MTKNRTLTPVYLDPGMHSGLEIKGLILKNNTLRNLKQHNHRGITFTQNMQWTTHINNIVSSAITMIHLMNFKYKWSRNSLLICYTNFIRPLIDYANVVYANLSIQDSNELRIITGAIKRLSSKRHY